ncbi:MAG: 6-phosphogluconolactonase [Gemmatimonadota bacterium]
MMEVVDDATALAQRATARFVSSVRRATAERGRCVVLLSGGTTPRATYARLAKPEIASQIDWSRLHLCFGDERCVPVTDPRNTFRMVREVLTSHVPLPDEQLYRIRTELTPADAALDYEQTLRALLGTDRPDLVFLGLGDDGHTASLFPGHAPVRELVRWVVADELAEQSMWRVTVTPPLLNAAREVVFLVSGAGKSSVLQSVLQPPRDPDSLPAQVIRPTNGRLEWIVDRAAAGPGGAGK